MGGGAAHPDPNQVGPTARQLLHMRENIQNKHQTPDLIEEGSAVDPGLTIGERHRERSPFEVQRTVAANAATTVQVRDTFPALILLVCTNHLKVTSVR